MTLSSPRIPEVLPADFTEEQRELVGQWTHMKFSTVMARSPALYRVFVPLIEKLIARTCLPPRDRQVLVLRTLNLCNDVYEAAHHQLISKGAGLTDAEIAAMQAGEGNALNDFDRVLVRAAEQLVRSQFIDDATWAALAARYDHQQLMEVVALVGTYLTMAMMTRNYQIPLEDEETFRSFSEIREYT
ncbi:MAG: carboxymuconolactone decarboxylase family protein [Novosphingobium sp.]|nr:carboxymuconolactone decarboxylase family protein [Novosphingobium sp.]